MAGLGHQLRLHQGPGRERGHLGPSPPGHLIHRQVGHVHVEHRRIAARGPGQQDGGHPGPHLGGGVPLLVLDHGVPTLALHAEPGHGLAHGQPGQVAVAGGEGGTHGAGVVDRPAGVGPGVDAGHHQVEPVAERSQPGEGDAQRRWARHRPGGGHPGHLGPADLGPDQVQGSQRRTRTRVLPVRRRHHHVAQLGEAAGEDVEADGVDAVVVGDQDAHGSFLAHPTRRRPTAR